MKRLLLGLIILMMLVFSSSAQVWISSFEMAKTVALKENKLILVDFYADWCGPCKSMDKETWSNPEVKKQMQKVVSAKINVDYNKALATTYNVKAIPNMVIIDGYGNILHREIGYKSEEQILRLLSGFPDNIKELESPLAVLNEESKNPDALFEVAFNYQKIAKKAEGKSKNIFIGESNSYFVQAKKFYKKAKKTEKIECVELLKCYNKIILGQSKSAIKEIEKTGIENLQKCNLALAYYVVINGFIDLQDIEKAKLYFEKLKNLNAGSDYVTEIESSYSEIIQG